MPRTNCTPQRKYNQLYYLLKFIDPATRRLAEDDCDPVQRSNDAAHEIDRIRPTAHAATDWDDDLER
ncbi:MAG: hypothetical protein ACYTBJ_16095 [Planctomycetota bacterium]|jgi:hypothetical protein